MERHLEPALPASCRYVYPSSFHYPISPLPFSTSSGAPQPTRLTHIDLPYVLQREQNFQFLTHTHIKCVYKVHKRNDPTLMFSHVASYKAADRDNSRQFQAHLEGDRVKNQAKIPKQRSTEVPNQAKTPKQPSTE